MKRGCDNELCDASLESVGCVDFVKDECCPEPQCPNGKLLNICSSIFTMYGRYSCKFNIMFINSLLAVKHTLRKS